MSYKQSIYKNMKKNVFSFDPYFYAFPERFQCVGVSKFSTLTEKFGLFGNMRT